MEEHSLNMQQVYEYLKAGRWFRQTSSVGMFFLGGYYYNATTRFGSTNLGNHV